MLVCTLSSWPSLRSLACCLATNWDGYPLLLTEATSTVSSSTFTMLTLSNQSQSRADWRKSSCRLTGSYPTAWGFKLQLHKMDNEMSHDVKTFISKENACLQYTPPNIRRTNLAEREIHTWKNHFLSGIAGLPKTSWLQVSVASPTKQTSSSTCYGHAVKTLLYWHLRHSKGPTHSMQQWWLL